MAMSRIEGNSSQDQLRQAQQKQASADEGAQKGMLGIATSVTGSAGQLAGAGRGSGGTTPPAAPAKTETPAGTSGGATGDAANAVAATD